MPIDRNTRALITGIFGKFESSLQCKNCKESISIIPINEIIDLTQDDLEKRFYDAVPKAVAHRCADIKENKESVKS